MMTVTRLVSDKMRRSRLVSLISHQGCIMNPESQLDALRDGRAGDAFTTHYWSHLIVDVPQFPDCLSDP